MLRVMNAIGLACVLGLGQTTLAGPPAREQVVPFDISLVARPGDRQACGVFAVRPAAILNRPGTKAVCKLANTQIDTLTAALKPGGVGIHIEDVEQVMGRIYIQGENKSGKRSMMMSLNVLRTTRDIDWVKLRDACGPKMKQHVYKGETYVSYPMPGFLRGITGVNGNAYLWAADARTLIVDVEDTIKALIEEKAGRTKPPLPDYAAGWDVVSRGLFALALDNHRGRLLRKSATGAELKEALADSARPEYHVVRLFQNMSGMVIGFGGQDDFHLDLHTSAGSRAEAAKMAESCQALLKIGRKQLTHLQSKSAASEAGQGIILSCLKKVLSSAAVRQQGTVVTLHAEVATGFDTVLAKVVAGMLSDKE
jgi:hypothetical protein